MCSRYIYLKLIRDFQSHITVRTKKLFLTRNCKGVKYLNFFLLCPTNKGLHHTETQSWHLKDQINVGQQQSCLGRWQLMLLLSSSLLHQTLQYDTVCHKVEDDKRSILSSAFNTYYTYITNRSLYWKLVTDLMIDETGNWHNQKNKLVFTDVVPKVPKHHPASVTGEAICRHICLEDAFESEYFTTEDHERNTSDRPKKYQGMSQDISINICDILFTFYSWFLFI